MTEYELFQALRPLYPALEYALLPQVANGTGSQAVRHCDALVLSLWPSRGMYLSGFEIKSHRSDWVRELRNPEKAEDVAQFCNYWWVVAGDDFIKLDELPKPWGLLTWNEKMGRLLRTKVAPFRKVPRPDLPFIAGVIRKAQEVVTPAYVIAEARKAGYEAGKQDAGQAGKYDREELGRMKKMVRDFEKASGVKIGEWNAGDIGAAVLQVINGTESRGRERLITAAQQTLRELGVTAPEA